jgi:hypothetical protein
MILLRVRSETGQGHAVGFVLLVSVPSLSAFAVACSQGKFAQQPKAKQDVGRAAGEAVNPSLKNDGASAALNTAPAPDEQSTLHAYKDFLLLESKDGIRYN